MTKTELLASPSATGLPSGYERSAMIYEKAVLDGNALPWLDSPVELSVAQCNVQGGETFYLASAIGTHPRLVEAAEALTDRQQQITNNMFYSRVPEFIARGHSPNVETMASPSTPFPIFVMRNNGGQRVYFARHRLVLKQYGEPESLIIRLGACDKNKQAQVLSVLSGLSRAGHRRKLSK